MGVDGSDDTLASSLPTLSGGKTEVAEVVANRYEIVRWLGGGGMGRVYEVRDTELDERVALKVLRGGLSEEAIERFRREVRLTRRIQHRNVARMFDIGEHDGDKFLTMELVDGEPLTRELGAALPWPRVQSLAIQICAGLAAAHRAGVDPPRPQARQRADRARHRPRGDHRLRDRAQRRRRGGDAARRRDRDAALHGARAARRRRRRCARGPVLPRRDPLRARERTATVERGQRDLDRRRAGDPADAAAGARARARGVRRDRDPLPRHRSRGPAADRRGDRRRDRGVRAELHRGQPRAEHHPATAVLPDAPPDAADGLRGHRDRGAAVLVRGPGRVPRGRPGRGPDRHAVDDPVAQGAPVRRPARPGRARSPRARDRARGRSRGVGIDPPWPRRAPDLGAVARRRRRVPDLGAAGRLRGGRGPHRQRAARARDRAGAVDPRGGLDERDRSGGRRLLPPRARRAAQVLGRARRGGHRAAREGRADRADVGPDPVRARVRQRPGVDPPRAPGAPRAGRGSGRARARQRVRRGAPRRLQPQVQPRRF